MFRSRRSQKWQNCSCAFFLFPHVLPARESGCHLICCGHTQRSRETTVFQLRSVGCGVYSGPPTNKDDRSCGNRPAFPGHVSHTCHSFWPYAHPVAHETKQGRQYCASVATTKGPRTPPPPPMRTPLMPPASVPCLASKRKTTRTR